MINKIIKQELQKYEVIKKMIMSRRGGTEERTLTCRKVHGRFQYCINRKYVSKIKALDSIREVAREEYRKKLLPLLED